jgi:hypothetical protein
MGIVAGVADVAADVGAADVGAGLAADAVGAGLAADAGAAAVADVGAGLAADATGAGLLADTGVGVGGAALGTTLSDAALLNGGVAGLTDTSLLGALGASGALGETGAVAADAGLASTLPTLATTSGALSADVGALAPASVSGLGSAVSGAVPSFALDTTVPLTDTAAGSAFFPGSTGADLGLDLSGGATDLGTTTADLSGTTGATTSDITSTATGATTPVTGSTQVASIAPQTLNDASPAAAQTFGAPNGSSFTTPTDVASTTSTTSTTAAPSSSFSTPAINNTNSVLAPGEPRLTPTLPTGTDSPLLSQGATTTVTTPTTTPTSTATSAATGGGGTLSSNLVSSIEQGGLPQSTIDAINAGDAAAQAGGEGLGSQVGSYLMKNPQAVLSALGLAANLMKGDQMPKYASNVSAEAAQLQAQGAQLQGYLTSGTLPPGIAASLSAAHDSAAATIRSQYAARGQSGSSAEMQDLANLAQTTVSQGASIANQLLTTGVNEQEFASGLYQNLMQTSMQQDIAMSNAIAGFTNAMAGGFSKSLSTPTPTG